MPEGELELIRDLAEAVVKARPELKETMETLLREADSCKEESRQIQGRPEPLDGQDPCFEELLNFIETCPAYARREVGEEPFGTGTK